MTKDIIELSLQASCIALCFVSVCGASTPIDLDGDIKSEGRYALPVHVQNNLVLSARNPDFAVVLVRVMATQGSGSASDAERLAGQSWIADSIADARSDGARSIISFEQGGAVHGSAGCNRFHGTFSFEGNKLSISQLATTRMMCEPAVMEQEQKFLAALNKTREFRVDGTHLTFFDATGEALIRFTLLR